MIFSNTSIIHITLRFQAPLTAKHELGCFNGAFESRPSTNQPATFVEFSSEACDKDDARPPFDDR